MKVLARIPVLFLFFAHSFPLSAQGPFPIGDFIRQHIHYPDSAKYYRIQGTVYIRFIVEPDGTVDSVNVVKGIIAPDKKLQVHADALNAEALKVIRLLPRLNPYRLDPKPVSFCVPIRFTLKY